MRWPCRMISRVSRRRRFVHGEQFSGPCPAARLCVPHHDLLSFRAKGTLLFEGVMLLTIRGRRQCHLSPPKDCQSALIGRATSMRGSRMDDVFMHVECGVLEGWLVLPLMCRGSSGHCIFHDGRWLTPNEFQSLSGRNGAKDWKRSIRHNGKSLKLLHNKGILKAHPADCDCQSLYAGESLWCASSRYSSAKANRICARCAAWIIFHSPKVAALTTSSDDAPDADVRWSRNPPVAPNSVDNAGVSRAKERARLTSIIEHLTAARGSTLTQSSARYGKVARETLCFVHVIFPFPNRTHRTEKQQADCKFPSRLEPSASQSNNMANFYPYRMLKL
ncbi:Hypothetical predicted protein [Cloeon dipterum]|uniref:SAND domain-containing protein n=1 Tax=Cloeon dipterum TaxID=197152 RepID=A0A8S1DAA5_9INSE|nr:Hypothetical predicted protein [Cloeon dipterum]